jgi:hypothetical protein
MTRLQTGRPGFDSRKRHERDFSLPHTVQIGSGAHLDTYPVGTGALSLGSKSVRGMNLITHLQVLPWLRMGGAMPPVPQYVFIAWCLIKQRMSSWPGTW